MYRAFPCSDYYGSSVAILGFQRLNLIALRRPNLGNPHLACIITISATNCRMRRSTFSPHIAVAEEPVYTKNEQGDKYGLREASALHKEWYEHAEGYCSTLKGKTMAEIAAQPTDGSDADLKALCTISVTDLQKAVLAALAET